MAVSAQNKLIGVAVGVVVALCCCGGLAALGGSDEDDEPATTVAEIGEECGKRWQEATASTGESLYCDGSRWRGVRSVTLAPTEPTTQAPDPEPTVPATENPNRDDDVLDEPEDDEEEPEESAYYANCAAARRAGAAPIYRGDPGYRRALDRDGDGVACDR